MLDVISEIYIKSIISLFYITTTSSTFTFTQGINRVSNKKLGNTWWRIKRLDCESIANKLGKTIGLINKSITMSISTFIVAEY